MPRTLFTTAFRAAPKRNASAGATLVELLVAFVVLGLLLGVAALYLKAVEAPLRTGGEMLESLLRQVRATAVATTTVHRVRPDSAHTLVVEHADSCGSASWTSDPRFATEFPDDVVLSETDWALCFSRRGIASDTLTLTLSHPDFGSRQLRVLRGGTMRWVQ